MTSNMQQTIRDLKLTQIEIRKLQSELEATPLWKKYHAARRKESQLKSQLENLQFEAARAELEKEFECVTGHNYEHYSQKFLIVHKDCPHIVSINVNGDYDSDEENSSVCNWNIHCKGKTILPRGVDTLILASGHTEESAWKRAVEEWNLYSHYQKDCMLGKF